ncbi:MAG: AAA family ATPase [Alphaproteobacteria bacterium]|nr:AAA family ATPase [Alphaproteobacteria bacterium]
MVNVDKNLFLRQSNNILAIASGVGSMGKTWFAMTLAQAINHLQQSVLVVDADNGLSNISFQTGLSGTVTINDVIDGDYCFNQAVLSVKKNFDIIGGTAGSEILETVPTGRLQILREDLMIMAQNYDKVIIDMPTSDKIITHFIPQDVNLILVCTNDPSNLVSTYKFLQDAVSIYKYKSLQIVVNYANSYEEGLQTYNTLRRACEQFIKSTPRLLGVIRRDTRVRDAIRNHVLLLNRYPNSEAAEDMMNIAHRLLEQGENIDGKV